MLNRHNCNVKSPPGQSVDAAHTLTSTNITSRPVYNVNMYAKASKIEGLPIISLHSGEAIAWVNQPLIETATFNIMGLICENASKQSQILIAPDIRQLATDCIIIDDDTVLSDPKDLIRLQNIIHEHYTPRGKLVITDLDRKLGTVKDYSIDLTALKIHQLFVQQSFLGPWFGGELTVEQSQIIDITPKRIIVRDTTTKSPVLQSEPLP